MVGEIRDLETASIAVQASLTGHLVLSTLHTNDSAGALTRLIDIGVEPFLIASSLVGVLAQRLVRLLCPACRTPMTLGRAEAKELGINTPAASLDMYTAAGCDLCMDSGYKGRIGIFEYLAISDSIRSLVVKGADSNRIMQRALAEGMRALRRDGIEKVMRGVTTLDEVLRVTDENPSEEIV
jgi:general secretion pathway protein E